LQNTADNTLAAVQKSNETAQKLLEVTNKLRDLNDRLANGMDKTNAAIHLQVLTVALQQLLAPENTAVLTPPARMLPYAQVFSQEATTQELIEVFYTFFTDTIQGGTTTKPNPKADDLHIAGRQVSLTAASAIAAFASQDKMQTILHDQVDLGGRYQDTAYYFALCRYTFIRDYFFNTIVEDTATMNIGALAQSVQYFDQLKFVARLPADKLRFTVPSFVPNDDKFDNLTVVLDPKEVGKLSRKAVRRFHDDLSSEVFNSAQAQQLLKHFAN
jgi:hypothetical protein